MNEAPSRARWTLRRKLAWSGVTALLALVALEVGFRVLYPAFGGDAERYRAYRSFVCDGEVPRYEPHPYLVYTFRPAGPDGDVNALGFKGPLPKREKPAGTIRIACLGGSTTASGNAEGDAGSYPRLLEQELRAGTGLKIEVLNFGVDAWTSAESLVNFVVNVRDYSPDWVLIHHAPNDGGPRFRPGFRRDYSHFRQTWRIPEKHWLDLALTRVSDLWAWMRGRMQREIRDIATVVNRPFDVSDSLLRDGRFPAGTEEPFVRNLRTIVELTRLEGARAALVTVPFDGRGAHPNESITLACREHNELARRLAAEEDVLLVDLAAEMTTDDPEVVRELLDRVHFTPAGNLMKAKRIADALAPRLEARR